MENINFDICVTPSRKIHIHGHNINTKLTDQNVKSKPIKHKKYIFETWGKKKNIS